jgi:histidinol-phosphate aminotransferase
VVQVYPSQANFILARVRDRDAFAARAYRHGILIRSFAGDPMLVDCVRITVGRPEDNSRLLDALARGK